MASTGIGERLRSAREALGLSLEEVEAATRIRRSYLDALEQDAWDRLPGPAYARGFLRAYARHLGLGPEDLPELRPAGAGTPALAPSKASPVEVRLTPGAYLSPARRALIGLAILVGIGVVFVAYVLYGQVRQFIQTAPAQVPHPAASAPQSPAPAASAPAANVRTPAPAGAAPSRAAAGGPKPAAPAQAPSTPTTAGAPAKPPGAAPAPAPSATALPPAAGQAPGPPAAAPAAGPEKPAAQAKPAGQAKPAAAAPLKVAVSASGYSWVRTVADGTTVFEGFLNAGDKQVWQASRTLTVRVGNAAAIAISVNGRPVGPLGGSGQIYEHSFSATSP